MYFSFVISVSSKLFCECDFFEDFDALVISSVLSLPIESPVASAVFWLALFEAVFNASAAAFLALSKRF